MNRSRSPLPPVALIASLTLVLAACAGGGAASQASSAAPAVSSAPSTAASIAAQPSAAASEGTTASGGAAEQMTVRLENFAFNPSELTIPAGTRVTFTNADSAAHTVTEGVDGTAAPNARFDDELQGNQSTMITFDEPGEYQITCRFHPSMNMTVTVEG